MARISRIQAVMTLSWDVLSTLTPVDYLKFRDVLGTVNQRVGTAADRCLLFVAGRAVDLADPFDLISPESR